MKVLSLFDGMSCGQIALNRIGIVPSAYYAAEIDKYAIQVTKHNHPNTIHLGSVTDWQTWDIPWGEIDLVTGGFPCQAWSVAGKQQGDKDDRGMLFWVMLDIMRNVLDHNPNAKFLIENVKMKKEFEQYITHHTEQALGLVHKTLINSALVSAQNRQRYYWTNFEVTQPQDKGVVLADIIESNDISEIKFVSDNDRVMGISEDDRGFRPHKGDKAKSGISELGRILKPTASKTDTLISTHAPKVLCGEIRGRYNSEGKTEQQLETRGDEKTNSLTTVQKDNVVVLSDSDYSPRSKQQIKKNSKMPHQKAVAVCSNANMTGSGVNVLTTDNLTYRKLTPLECERLQTVPDNYTAVVSNSQRYKMLGNGWTVDVIAHILECGLK